VAAAVAQVHDGAPEAVDLSHQNTIELWRQPFRGFFLFYLSQWRL
jgi:hypothetical protein